MSIKPVIRRHHATVDIDQVVTHYLTEASASVAQAFIDALEEAYIHIGRHPSSGSPRIGNQQQLPGLRSWRISGFPYLAFYVEQIDHIDLWRVLHTSRDIPESLREDVDD